MRIGDDQTVVLAVSLNNVEFPRAGRYAFNLEIDGSVEARAPLTVLKAEAPPSTAT
jgi:hypothetical protein